MAISSHIPSSLVRDSLPLTLAEAVSRDDYSLFVLLFVALPIMLSLLCAIVESGLGLALFRDAARGRMVKGALIANLAGFAILFAGCISVFAGLTYLNTLQRMPLGVVTAYLLPVLFALWAKASIFRRYLPIGSRRRIKWIYVLSHPLAAALLYYIHDYYIRAVAG